MPKGIYKGQGAAVKIAAPCPYSGRRCPLFVPSWAGRARPGQSPAVFDGLYSRFLFKNTHKILYGEEADLLADVSDQMVALQQQPFRLLNPQIV